MAEYIVVVQVNLHSRNYWSFIDLAFHKTDTPPNHDVVYLHYCAIVPHVIADPSYKHGRNDVWSTSVE